MIAFLDKWLRKDESTGRHRTSRHFRLWDGKALELVERSTGIAEYKDTSHWKVRLRDLDPDHVRLESYGGHRRYITIYTKFFREVVAVRSWSSTCGYKRETNRVYIMFPVRKSPTKGELNALKAKLRALQARQAPAPQPPGGLDVAHLRRRVKELKGVIEGLANDVDFSAHAGAGVVEQDLSVCVNTLKVTLRQLRKYSASTPGSRITTVVPLYLLSRETYRGVDRPNPNPGAMARGIPPARICAQCDHMPIRQHFVNPDKEFDHECYWDEV